MCDQDHFEEDRLDFEARGLVTRRQFGALLGAGVVMMLPKVVNAVAVTESEVTVKTPDGTADCYFVHPFARWPNGSRSPGMPCWW
jgi:carboxymethylenebutenolidase